MWAFFGTITLLGTAVPSAPWWPLPAFLWPGRRPLANCPPRFSSCVSVPCPGERAVACPPKWGWPALLRPQGSCQAPRAPGAQGSLRLAWGTRAGERKRWWCQGDSVAAAWPHPCVRGPGCWVKGRERTMMALDKLPEEKCPLTSRESPSGRPRGQGGVSSPREVADGKGHSASAHPMA